MDYVTPDYSLAMSVLRTSAKSITEGMAYVAPVEQALASATEAPNLTVGELAFILLVDLSVEVRRAPPPTDRSHA